jgi:hypothetical protein
VLVSYLALKLNSVIEFDMSFSSVAKSLLAVLDKTGSLTASVYRARIQPNGYHLRDRNLNAILTYGWVLLVNCRAMIALFTASPILSTLWFVACMDLQDDGGPIPPRVRQVFSDS